MLWVVLLFGIVFVVVIIVWFDFLCDEGVVYVCVLVVVGVWVKYYEGFGLIYGYFGMGDVLDVV